MTTEAKPCVIAADGGGSRCRVAISVAGQIFAGESSSANVSSDSDGAMTSLTAALAAAAAAAGRDPASLRHWPAYLGLAGIMGPGDAARLQARLPFTRVRVQDDRPAAVLGALGARDGAVAGIGTGSFVGRQTGGVLRLVGGWGFRLGDEASAAWLGRGLLVSALRTVDGFAPATALTASVLDGFGGPGGIVAFAASAGGADLGRLAPQVTKAAGAGDPAALALMRAGAAYVEQALAALGWQPPEPLCLIGGVAGVYAPYLGPEARAALVAPRGSALDGALELARRFAGELAGREA